MGAKSDLETAEAVKENLQEQIEQKMALVHQLELALKEIEDQIASKRAKLFVSKLET